MQDDAYEKMSEKAILIQICKNTGAIKGILLFYLVLTILGFVGYCVIPR